MAAALRRRGAAVLDLDEVSKQVVIPGAPTLEVLRKRFGDEIISSSGQLDR